MKRFWFIAIAAAFALSSCGEDAADQQNQQAEKALATRTGLAGWYDPPEGSSAAEMTETQFTAAQNEFPKGSALRVTNLGNDQSVEVIVTDTGVPAKYLIDLSREAAKELGITSKGEVRVRVELLQRGK